MFRLKTFLCIAYLLLQALQLCAQEEQTVFQLTGTVLRSDSLTPLMNVHIINKNTLKGTVSSRDGTFMMLMRESDTILFSSIGYTTYSFTWQEGMKNHIQILLQPQTFLLEEVDVVSGESGIKHYKTMEKEAPLIPETEDVVFPEPVKPGIMNPLDYLYEKFGDRPRQLRELAKLEQEDAYRAKLQQGKNAQWIMTITGLPAEELESFLFFCKYTGVPLNTISDYEFLRSVKRCFKDYKRIKQHNTEEEEETK